MKASPLPRIIGHRGSVDRWPEQTAQAYAAALDSGADGVECDVQLTADGVAVCFHDDTVDRTTTGTGAVAALTLAQLRALPVRALVPETGSAGGSGTTSGSATSGSGPAPSAVLPAEPAPLVTLAELVTLVRSSARAVTLVIELKPTPHASPDENARLVAAVLDILRAEGWEQATNRLADSEVSISIMSFDTGLLEMFERAEPGARDALMPLVDSNESPEDSAAVRRIEAGLAEHRPSHAGPGIAFVRRFPELVTGWIEAGALVRVWTVNTLEDLALCVSVGVQEITTDLPGRIRDLV